MASRKRLGYCPGAVDGLSVRNRDHYLHDTNSKSQNQSIRREKSADRQTAGSLIPRASRTRGGAPVAHAIPSSRQSALPASTSVKPSLDDVAFPTPPRKVLSMVEQDYSNLDNTMTNSSLCGTRETAPGLPSIDQKVVTLNRVEPGNVTIPPSPELTALGRINGLDVTPIAVEADTLTSHSMAVTLSIAEAATLMADNKRETSPSATEADTLMNVHCHANLKSSDVMTCTTKAETLAKSMAEQVLDDSCDHDNNVTLVKHTPNLLSDDEFNKDREEITLLLGKMTNAENVASLTTTIDSSLSTMMSNDSNITMHETPLAIVYYDGRLKSNVTQALDKVKNTRHASNDKNAMNHGNINDIINDKHHDMTNDLNGVLSDNTKMNVMDNAPNRVDVKAITGDSAPLVAKVIKEKNDE